MSLKVPKANNIQLFKDGYKVMSDRQGFAMNYTHILYVHSTYKVLRMPFYETYKQ